MGIELGLFACYNNITLTMYAKDFLIGKGVINSILMVQG